MAKQHWKTAPEAHDFPAAADFLELLLPPAAAWATVRALKAAPTVRKKAKDLSRAGRIALLAAGNVHVSNDLRKIKRGELLSPVLLVRGDAARNMPLIVADGFHRICASYLVDEDADIPCRIVDLPHPS